MTIYWNQSKYRHTIHINSKGGSFWESNVGILQWRREAKPKLEVAPRYNKIHNSNLRFHQIHAMSNKFSHPLLERKSYGIKPFWSPRPRDCNLEEFKNDFMMTLVPLTYESWRHYIPFENFNHGKSFNFGNGVYCIKNNCIGVQPTGGAE